MGAMHGLGRWLINVRTGSRAARVFALVAPALALGPGTRVLELGSGGGGMIALIHERYAPARLVGTDVDPVEVDAARAYLARRFGTMPQNIELRPADALALPFEDRSFDCVLAFEMLHHVEPRHSAYENRPTALREIRRVLSPGGRLAYSEFSQKERVRESLVELGFAPVLQRRRGRSDVAVYAAPPPDRGIEAGPVPRG